MNEKDFTDHDTTLYKNVYETAIKNLNSISKDTRINEDLIKSECEKYSLFAMNRSKNHKGILSDAVLLWGMPNDSKVKFCEYLKFPVTKLEVAKSYLRIFMSLRQVYERLFKIKSDPTLFMVNAKELQKKIGRAHV